MEFTYEAYRNLIHMLNDRGYKFADYHNCDDFQKCVILRHDIDTSLEKALALAELENAEGVTSTYFVLVTSEFYNILAKDNIAILRKINELGHEIGLHFDEVNYPECVGKYEIEQKIKSEISIIEMVLGEPVNTVSMHRPSKQTLDADYEFKNVINSYGKKFFRDYKYVSDSRRRWREDVESIISSEKYEKLHILTHAFWYHDECSDIENDIRSFVFNGNNERYKILEKNITDLNSILKKDDVI